MMAGKIGGFLSRHNRFASGTALVLAVAAIFAFIYSPRVVGAAVTERELPVYSDVTAERVVPYGLMTQAMFIRDNKISMLTNQAKLFERGVNNTNSNADVAYEGVAVPSTPDTPETPDTPNPAKSATGDTMNVTLWVVVAIASCAAIPAVVVVCRRRTSR